MLFYSSPAMQRNKTFLARVEWLPVSSRLYVMDGRTDERNIGLYSVAMLLLNAIYAILH